MPIIVSVIFRLSLLCAVYRRLATRCVTEKRTFLKTISAHIKSTEKTLLSVIAFWDSWKKGLLKVRDLFFIKYASSTDSTTK
jgi:hypothetical protein